MIRPITEQYVHGSMVVESSYPVQCLFWILGEHCAANSFQNVSGRYDTLIPVPRTVVIDEIGDAHPPHQCHP